MSKTFVPTTIQTRSKTLTASNSVCAKKRVSNTSIPPCPDNDWAVDETGTVITCSAICTDTCPSIGGSGVKSEDWAINMNRLPPIDPALVNCTYSSDQFKTGDDIAMYQEVFLNPDLPDVILAKNRVILDTIQVTTAAGRKDDKETTELFRTVITIVIIIVLILFIILVFATKGPTVKYR